MIYYVVRDTSLEHHHLYFLASCLRTKSDNINAQIWGVGGTKSEE